MNGWEVWLQTEFHIEIRFLIAVYRKLAFPRCQVLNGSAFQGLLIPLYSILLTSNRYLKKHHCRQVGVFFLLISQMNSIGDRTGGFLTLHARYRHFKVG